MFANTITITGNVVEEIDLRYTPSGQAVAQFRVASTERYRDQQSGQWRDGSTVFLTCTVWRQVAENVAESLVKGTRVLVVGRLRQRSYETDEGAKRTVYEVDVDEVGVSLKHATAKVTKAQRTAGAAAAEAGETRGSDEPPF